MIASIHTVVVCAFKIVGKATIFSEILCDFWISTLNVMRAIIT